MTAVPIPADLEYGTLMEALVSHADKHHDGHFTVMKFTTNWRVGFGTPGAREDIQTMCSGATFAAAAWRALAVESAIIVRGKMP